MTQFNDWLESALAKLSKFNESLQLTIKDLDHENLKLWKPNSIHKLRALTALIDMCCG